MADSYKNILITPNAGNTSDPKIEFSGANSSVNTDITLYVYPESNGTLSFEGSAGQLFSITNDLSNTLSIGGTLFVSGNAEFEAIIANGNIGTDGQVLTSNGSVVYWSTLSDAEGVTSVASGNGITGGTITSTGTLYAVGANGINVTTSGINVDAGNSQVVSNTTGVWIIESNINHDNLSGFISDEHIAHSGVTLTAGNGLTGGGTIASSRSFAVGAANGITVSADAVAVDGANGITVTSAGVNIDVGNNQLVSNSTGIWIDESNINHDNLSGFVSNEHVDHTSVSMTAANGLSGGGTIASSRSFNVVAGNSQVVSNTTGVWIVETNISHDNLSGFVSSEHVNHSSVSITAGSGLTGGGTIASTRTINVGGGTGINVSADAVGVNTAYGFTWTGVHTFNANVSLGTTRISANGGVGTSGYVLTSGGTGGNVYWSEVSGGGASVAGANNEIQYHSDGSFGAEPTFTYDPSTNTMSVGNSTINTTINSTATHTSYMSFNNRNITTNYTITANESAYGAGPITVDNGITLTINDGARYVII